MSYDIVRPRAGARPLPPQPGSLLERPIAAARATLLRAASFADRHELDSVESYRVLPVVVAIAGYGIAFVAGKACHSRDVFEYTWAAIAGAGLAVGPLASATIGLAKATLGYRPLPERRF